MNPETTQVGKLQALLDKVLVNAAALRQTRAAGAPLTAPGAAASPPVDAAPGARTPEVAAQRSPLADVPRGGTLEPVPFVPEPALVRAEPVQEFAIPEPGGETEPLLLVRRVSAPPAAEAVPTVVAEMLDAQASAELPVLEPDVSELEPEPPMVLEPEIVLVDEPRHESAEPAPIMAEAEPTSSDRRAALNLEVPRAPAVPVLEPAREGDSLEAPPMPPIELDAGLEPAPETIGEELTTIPPSAPGVAEEPLEPQPMQLEAEFSLQQPASSQVERDFSASAPPPLEDIEAPPISTEQETEGLGVSLGFAPQPVEQSIADEEDSLGTPRTPPPESGPQVSLAPKELEELEVQVVSSPDLKLDRGEGPTMEQVGQTINFGPEDRESRELEVQERVSATPGAKPDDFEAELPRVGFAGAYDASLAPPATARQELEAHDRVERERAERRSLVPGSGPVHAETAIPGPLHGQPLETVSRSPVNISSPAAIYDSTRDKVVPGSFLDRLETSLGLAAPSE